MIGWPEAVCNQEKLHCFMHNAQSISQASKKSHLSFRIATLGSHPAYCSYSSHMRLSPEAMNIITPQAD